MMILGCGLFISAFTFLTEHLCSLVEHRLLQDAPRTVARLRSAGDWAELGWGVTLLLPGLALVALTLTVYSHNSVVCPDMFKQYDWIFCNNETDLQLQE